MNPVFVPMSVIVPMSGRGGSSSRVEFSKAWENFIGAAQSALGPILTLMAIIGVLMVIGSLAMWFFKKARGGGANTGGLMWTMIFGAILAAPTVIIPVLLRIVDFAINTIASVLRIN